MNSLTLTPDGKRPWWREPMVWLIAGLPLSAVVAGLTTVWIASENADTLVKEGYVKEGLTVSQIQDQDRVAARLGVGARLTVTPDGLRASITQADRQAVMPALIMLTLAHSTDATRDSTVVLKHVGQGQYLGRLADSVDGKRQLILESHEQGWRLRGTWEAPFEGSLDMSPPRERP